MARDFYKTLLVSGSGKGKTYSFKNMNVNTTGFINTEDKPLPFKNNFKYHSRPTNVMETKVILKQYSENPEITCIVLDSLSAYLDMILREARATKKGFELFLAQYDNNNNEKPLPFVNFIKNKILGKQLVINFNA